MSIKLATITIKRTIYQLIGREIILELIIRKIIWEIFSQEIIWHIGMVKSSTLFLRLVMFIIAWTSRVKIVGEENLKKIIDEKIIFVL